MYFHYLSIFTTLIYLKHFFHCFAQSLTGHLTFCNRYVYSFKVLCAFCLTELLLKVIKSQDTEILSDIFFKVFKYRHLVY